MIGVFVTELSDFLWVLDQGADEQQKNVSIMQQKTKARRPWCYVWSSCKCT